MNSIHAEKGMHCVDCHFSQDGHGNGYIHGEVAQAVQIRCKDCHGTADALPSLRTSGPAARPGGEDLTLIRNPDGNRRWIGSTNQQIHFLTNRYQAEDPCWKEPNTVELRWIDGELQVNGFPTN